MRQTHGLPGASALTRRIIALLSSGAAPPNTSMVRRRPRFESARGLSNPRKSAVLLPALSAQSTSVEGGARRPPTRASRRETRRSRPRRKRRILRAGTLSAPCRRRRHGPAREGVAALAAVLAVLPEHPGVAGRERRRWFTRLQAWWTPLCMTRPVS